MWSFWSIVLAVLLGKNDQTTMWYSSGIMSCNRLGLGLAAPSQIIRVMFRIGPIGSRIDLCNFYSSRKDCTRNKKWDDSNLIGPSKIFTSIVNSKCYVLIFAWLLFVGTPQPTIPNSQINHEVLITGSFCKKAYSPDLEGGNVQATITWVAPVS